MNGAGGRDTGRSAGRHDDRAATRGAGAGTGGGGTGPRRPSRAAAVPPEPTSPPDPAVRPESAVPPGTAGSAAATVAAADIARLAGVGRAAVSNWRRRFPDFPGPVGGTAASPLYSLAEVEAWFARHGRRLRVSPGDRTWQQVQASVDDLRLGELVGLLGVFLVLLRRRPQAWAELADRPDPVLAADLPAALRAAVPELPDHPPSPGQDVAWGRSTVDTGWMPAVRAVAELAVEHGPAGAFDVLCARYLEAHARRLSVTPPAVADVMVGLLALARAAGAADGTATGDQSGDQPGNQPGNQPGSPTGNETGSPTGNETGSPTGNETGNRPGDRPGNRPGVGGLAGAHVLDPACGVGNPLFAAARAGAARLAGQDVRGAPAHLTLARLLLAGTDARVAVGDSLLADAWTGEQVDAVVCNPPFNERSWGYDELTSDPRWEYGLPPRGEPELAWVQHCLAHVRPGGPVVVAMPPAAANRRPGRRIRGNLLRSGALRAVVGLPATAPAAPAADLWVLRRPDPSGADGGVPSHLLVVDAAPDLETVAGAWRAFLADPERQPPGPSASVRIVDLLDDEVDLSPRRHVADRAVETGAASVVDYAETRERLAAALASLPGLLPALSERQEGRGLVRTTVGELARAGVVTIQQAPLRMAVDGGDLPVLTVRDVRLGRPPSGRTTDQPGLLALQPGDVVVPALAREPVARVVAEADAGAVLGPQLFCFRADPDRIDPQFLAGFLRVARLVGAARPSAGSLRMDPRRAPIPRLPLDEQRGYGEAFQRLAQFEDLLRDSATATAELVRLGLTGLAAGTLRP